MKYIEDIQVSINTRFIFFAWCENNIYSNKNYDNISLVAITTHEI